MVFATYRSTVRCLVSVLLIECVRMDRYGPTSILKPLGDLDINQIEDDVDYSMPADLDDANIYDWSPPNGELPDDPEIPYLPEAGLGDFDFPADVPRTELRRNSNFLREKKTQVLCRVQRAIHHHKEAGQEFFPKSFTSYSCHPVDPSQADGSLSTSHETCYVSGSNCITIEKEQLFLKRRQNTRCWTHFIEAVGAGCKCLSRKY